MKKLIITGSPRSGTTALSVLLSQSEEILITNELAIFDKNTSNYWTKRKTPVPQRDGKTEQRLKSRGLAMTDLDNFFAGNFENKNKLVFFGDKFPTYCTTREYCEHLVEAHSDAFYIFTYRNPCAIVNSFIKRTKYEGDKKLSDGNVPNWLFKDIDSSLEKINSYNTNWSKFIFPYVQNKFIVDYDLYINRPCFLLKELSTFLGLHIEVNKPETIQGHTEFFDTGFRGLFEHSNPQEYKNTLSVDEINYINEKTKIIDQHIKRLLKKQQEEL